MRVCFWLSWSVNAVIAAVVLYFFFVGVGDGSVSSFNIMLWLGILVAVGAVVGGSLYLRERDKTRFAIILNLLLALPGLLIGLFFLVVILPHPRWN